MFKNIKTYLMVIILFSLTMLLSGCNNPIPPNEHVGKPPPNQNYNNSYYYDDYYYHNRRYY